MKKIAVFTEGQTEQIFVAGLIKFLAASRDFTIRKLKIYGGGRRAPILLEIDKVAAEDDQASDFYFLLIDCASDSRVISSIKERYQGLVAEGYECIIGIRDLAPDFQRNELIKFREKATLQLESDPVDPLLVIAVMEVEAWFIGEHSHFGRLSEDLTTEAILQSTSIDVETIDVSEIDEPYNKMKQIYDLAGLECTKSRADVERTVGALDFAHLTDPATLSRVESLRPLVNKLTELFEDGLVAPVVDVEDVGLAESL
ncbi:hypothetical protein [Agrobacterium tumefaciens]|uniref:DUF4276 family protein n=1 Tax=Agrobacterium tumefaciens TaxID=358 RepID=A0AB36ER14_AGRTU|nr:hypothetical protein A6U91_06265 [Agrobacterium tumefaciens]